ncbi:MAG TPA: DUF3488 and transglutaminase-like domain-containing protein [Blastocatellia bacterium]|nr:DUF3488 and transglutaminase-like domain-containing protein [Blastocatellia bacterium]
MDTYFRTTSYALVATAFIALALTRELDAISIVLYSAALAFCFYRDARQATRLRLREWMWRALSIAYVPFVFVDAVFLSRSRALALVHMTLFVSAAKLFQTKRDRDWVFLYLISFFQMLLAAGLTFNAIFVASLAAFLFFFMSTLAAFEIRRTRREVSQLDEEVTTRLKEPLRVKYGAKDEPRKRRRVRARYLLGASFVQLVIVATLTLPFFFLIPRLGSGSIARGFGDDDSITGFSDRVELGQVASIKKSQRVVMRVQLDRRPSRYLRWRGIALERYDGHAWSLYDPNSKRSSTEMQGATIGGERASKDPRFEFVHVLVDRYSCPGSLPERRPVREPLEQRFVREPLDTPTLFAALKPVTLRGAMAIIQQDIYTGALSADGLKGRTVYSIISDLSLPTEQELRADSPAASPECIRRLYTYVDKRKLDPRISQLAHEITRNAPTPYDKAKAIEDYLKTRFRYTLNITINGEDPLAEFLFDVREGHCEYFATAMVVMLWTLDIPARIVNGFQMGEYNDLNNLYTVRDSDAHSWVEAYFPRNQAWIEFDPTPSSGINDYSQGGFLSRFRKYMDAMEVFWLDYIVTLDSDEQASIMVDLQHRLLTLKDRALAYYVRVKLWVSELAGNLVLRRVWTVGALLKLSGAVVFTMLAALGFYVWVAYRKQRKLAPTGYGPWWRRLFILPTWRSKRFRKGDPRQSAVLFYEQMLAVAKGGGLVKQPYQTPVEFATGSAMPEIQQITALYNRVRFGSSRLDESEVRRVSSLLASLKNRVRGK